MVTLTTAIRDEFGNALDGNGQPEGSPADDYRFAFTIAVSAMPKVISFVVLPHDTVSIGVITVKMTFDQTMNIVIQPTVTLGEKRNFLTAEKKSVILVKRFYRL